MSESLKLELELFAIAFGYGIGIVAVYDIIRIIRRVIPHGQVYVALEDMFFWIWVTLIIFKMLFYRNDGALRFYIIMATMAGMILYSFTISKYVVKYVSKVINEILKYLLKPLKIIINTIKMIFNNTKNKVKKWLVTKKEHTLRRHQERVPGVKKEKN